MAHNNWDAVKLATYEMATYEMATYEMATDDFGHRLKSVEFG